MNKVAQGSERSRASKRLTPQMFRQRLLQLGPTFIKIGQYLALRPDRVPQEYCDALMSLLDQVPSFSWEAAKAILTEDLGGEPTEIFATVEPVPVAAGSLAQTHLARLKDGTEVAIKIQRPDIEAQVLRDLRRRRLIESLLTRCGVSDFASPREIVDEMTGWMLQEIDFSHELASLQRLFRLTGNSSIEKVPRPYPSLSGPRVITMEYLRGVPVSSLLFAVRSGRKEELARIKALGIDCDRFAENLVAACLRQIFRYQFFHADLHPGNLIALPGNVVGFVDFGLCDQLDAMVRKREMRYISAVYSGLWDQMFKALTEILLPSEQTDLDAFRRDFFGLQRETAEESDAPASRSPVGQWMIGVMRTARDHGLRVPPRILSMYRALLTAETVSHQLSRDADLQSVGREFFGALSIEEAFDALSPRNLQPVLLSLLTFLRDSPGHLHQLLSEVSDGRFVLKVNVSEAPPQTRARNRRSRLLATAILSVGAALLMTIPDLPAPFGISLQWPLWGGVLLLYIWTFIQWRRL